MKAPRPARRAPDLSRAARAIDEFLDALGAPEGDPELRDTGRRVAEAFANDLLSGYAMDPAEILAEATSSRATGLVVVRDLATTTICPHHLLPATGVVHVAYLPGPKVVGLGALGRVVDCFARRLILQEDLGQGIVDALVEHLGARGAGAIVDLAPTCVIARGDRRHGARAVTSAFAGAMADDASLRAEMWAAIGGGVRGAATEPT